MLNKNGSMIFSEKLEQITYKVNKIDMMEKDISEIRQNMDEQNENINKIKNESINPFCSR